MHIPDDMKKCAVFVALKDDREQYRFKGTAFFYLLQPPQGQGHRYLVTARHVVDKTAQYGADGKIHLRLNAKSGGHEFIETEHSAWVFDPDEAVDVAVLPLDEGQFHEVRSRNK